MGQGHAHGGGQSAAGKNKKNLAIVFGFTSSYLVAEVVGGLWFNSLALLADAGHMLTDVVGLALALFAIWFAEREATPEKTYGYYRIEILAATTNAVVLIGISLYILYEAYQRFRQPDLKVESGGMMAVAVLGLLINIAGMFILRAGSKESLNMKGAYFEVLSDMLTSVGVIIAALIIRFTGWNYADPLISAGIGLFILPRTWILLKDAVGILLEGTPSDVNLVTLREALKKIEGVADVHDLHVWALTSGMNAMSVHAVLANGAEHDSVLKSVENIIQKDFKIMHSTVQVETETHAAHETHL